MKKFLICLVFLLIVAFGKAQIVTNCGGNPGTSTDGSHKWDVCRIELYNDKVYVQFEITALKPIRRLNIYDDYGYLIYGREEEREGIGMKGLVNNSEIKYFGSNSNWGWDKIGRGEKVYYTLCYGGGGNNGNSIPSGATTISIYGVGVEIDGKRTSWKSTNLSINNPRMNYTNYSSEYSIRQYLDANNDGICGIYEQIGDNSSNKLACIKYNGEYALIFMSNNLGRNWWKMGDVKAYLHQSASGIFKADWFMSDKSLYKDCYVGFDGVSMTVLFPSESDEKEREKKYLKMYPTNPPSYNNNNQREYIPQRQQQQVPQRKQTIPTLKKQNVKK